MSISSAETEYRSTTITVCVILWLRWLLQDLGAEKKGPMLTMCDNKAFRNNVANPVYHEITKHVEMDCYFVCERVYNGKVKTVSIKYEFQTADIFTKALRADRFKFFCGKLGVQGQHNPT